MQELPNQIQAVIGPGGVQLSGGETQRVCIARALISKYSFMSSPPLTVLVIHARYLLCSPPVIVLDEATSSLDVMTEQRVHATMASLSHDTTSTKDGPPSLLPPSAVIALTLHHSEPAVIAVTHRISSLHLFDRILVMHQGKVA